MKYGVLQRSIKNEVLSYNTQNTINMDMTQYESELQRSLDFIDSQRKKAIEEKKPRAYEQFAKLTIMLNKNLDETIKRGSPYGSLQDINDEALRSASQMDQEPEHKNQRLIEKIHLLESQIEELFIYT